MPWPFVWETLDLSTWTLKPHRTIWESFTLCRVFQSRRKNVCFDRALAINLKKLGSDHDHVAATYNILANVHSDLGDLELEKELVIGNSLDASGEE